MPHPSEKKGFSLPVFSDVKMSFHEKICIKLLYLIFFEKKRVMIESHENLSQNLIWNMGWTVEGMEFIKKITKI